MSWNRDWSVAAQNIFDALKIQPGDRLALLYNSEPAGKELLIGALSELAKSRNIPSIAVSLTLDERFDIAPLEKKLYSFFDGTKSAQRKIFFTASKSHYGPSRRAIHRLVSVDSAKLAGMTTSLATDSPDIIFDLANTSPTKLWTRGEELKTVLSKASKIKITSAKGTDLTFNWDNKKRKYLISAGYPHTHEDRWDNLGGEIYTAPLHETVNGKFVIDGSIGGMGLVHGNIVVDIKNGRGVLNRKESTASKNTLDEFEKGLNIFPCACVVGEFGVGTTPNLKLVGELMQDEKVEGTIHLAFGDSYASDGSGGENNCDAHTDCLITSPTVDMTINGETVRLMDNGKFLF